MPVLRCFSCGHESGDAQAHRDHDRNHFVLGLMSNAEYLAQIEKDKAAQKEKS